jgi:hypothetical protein
MDRDSSALSTARFAGCLHVVAAGSEGRFEHAPPHPLHGVHSTTEGHLGVYLLSEGGSALGVWVGELPQVVSKPTRLSFNPLVTTGGSHSSARRASPYIHACPPMRLVDFLSEAHPRSTSLFVTPS